MNFSLNWILKWRCFHTGNASFCSFNWFNLRVMGKHPFADTSSAGCEILMTTLFMMRSSCNQIQMNQIENRSRRYSPGECVTDSSKGSPRLDFCLFLPTKLTGSRFCRKSLRPLQPCEGQRAQRRSLADVVCGKQHAAGRWWALSCQGDYDNCDRW